MRRTILVTACFGLFGCAASAPEEPDTFTQAATSWEGAPVADMIRVWGPPASQREATNGRSGLTYWRSYGLSGGIGGAGDTHRRCQISAYTDAAGIIERIEVNSNNCDRYFGDRLNALFRFD